MELEQLTRDWRAALADCVPTKAVHEIVARAVSDQEANATLFGDANRNLGFVS